MADLVVQNARTHNLKGLNLSIPKDKIVVFTGVSGSGKSSLVFDTIYTEAQRQLIETFSTFARRRLPRLSRPDVDEIRNLSTAILIDQKPMGRNMRSTVGTATEIATYLRTLYSRCARPFLGWSHRFSYNHPEGMCPACSGLGKRITINEKMLLDKSKSLSDGAIIHPEVKVGGYFWREITGSGLFDPHKPLARFSESELELLLYASDHRLEKEQSGVKYAAKFEGVVTRLERIFASKGEEEAPEKSKDAYQKYLVYSTCETCCGTRLNEAARTPVINERSIAEVCDLELDRLDDFLAGVDDPVGQPMVTKMRRILGHLLEIGVGYITLNRGVSTLSGGEAQRVKMARQLDCDLTGLLYILDEPSIGLHPRDTAQLIGLLRGLQRAGNSVLVVEHDPDIISAADFVVDIGPGAGTGGGTVCFAGSVDELQSSDSATGRLLGERGTRPRELREPSEWMAVEDACLNNLQDLSVKIPRGVLTCVTGVAGSGKSSLVHGVFVPRHPECIVVDQAPVGRTSRSNLLTYTGIFDQIRKVFAAATGRPASLFSFNSKGACPVCKGQGSVSVELSFLDDVRMVCSECEGKRYTDDVLALTWNGMTIFDVLKLTVSEAQSLFEIKKIDSQLQLLSRVGLGYLELGQPLSTLSGGEAQRLKLAAELGKSGNLYVLDEPTTGLHLSDTRKLLDILHDLVDRGNTVIVIEHNLDVIAQADWIIDLGPEGGRFGGRIIACGPPRQIASCKTSHTGRHLATYLGPVGFANRRTSREQVHQCTIRQLTIPVEKRKYAGRIHNNRSQVRYCDASDRGNASSDGGGKARR